MSLACSNRTCIYIIYVACSNVTCIYTNVTCIHSNVACIHTNVACIQMSVTCTTVACYMYRQKKCAMLIYIVNKILTITRNEY